MSRYPRPSYTPTATRPPQAPRSHSGPANHSMANFYKNTTAEMGNLICKRTLGLNLYSCNIFKASSVYLTRNIFINVILADSGYTRCSSSRFSSRSSTPTYQDQVGNTYI